MAYCTNCGAKIDTQFCPNCGTKNEKYSRSSSKKNQSIKSDSPLDMTFSEMYSPLFDAIKLGIKIDNDKRNITEKDFQSVSNLLHHTDKIIAQNKAEQEEMAKQKEKRRQARRAIANGKCPECGAKIGKNTDYCPKCGAECLKEYYEDY